MDHLRQSLTVLRDYYRNPTHNLKKILENNLENEGKRSNASVTRTVYGVIRRQNTLDYLIKQLSCKRGKTVHPVGQILLRMGIYHLLYSDSLPDYAVVNEVVKIAPGFLRAYLNALLRRISREKDKMHLLLSKIEDPAIRCSISPFLINEIKKTFGAVEEVLSYLNREPNFHLRVNTGRFTLNQVKDLLTEENIDSAEMSPLAGLMARDSGRRLRELMTKKACFYFQNSASQLVSAIAHRFSQGKVLDGCGAPGAKSATISLLNPSLRIFANDISQQRIGLLNAFCRQFQLHNIHCLASDMRQPGIKNSFDLILLDAPCTSSGTLRKNPDLKLKIDRNLVLKNVNMQKEILTSVFTGFTARYILYSVCSFIHDETEGLMEKLIKSSFNHWKPINLQPMIKEYGFKAKEGAHGWFLVPDDSRDNDLFYLSLFERSNPSS